MEVLIFLPLVLLLVGLLAWSARARARGMLDRWAEENGYRLLQIQERFMRRGPFTFTSSNGQLIYRITIEDFQGQQFEGFARCGGFFWGPWTHKVEVRWDGE